MKIIKPLELLEQWIEIVRTRYFPAHIFKEKRPDLILKLAADDLPAHREKFRHTIDTLVGKVLAADTPENVAGILSATDPELVALFYDRLQCSIYMLRVFRQKGGEFVEAPASSWKELATKLLYQKPFH